MVQGKSEDITRKRKAWDLENKELNSGDKLKKYDGEFGYNNCKTGLESNKSREKWGTESSRKMLQREG